jgi:hypothetical protein
VIYSEKTRTDTQMQQKTLETCACGCKQPLPLLDDKSNKADGEIIRLPYNFTDRWQGYLS